MNIAQIETKLKSLIEYFNQFEFIYSLLEAYNFPKATIAKLKKGNLNFSKNPGELILRKKLFFKEEFMFDLHETIIAIKDNTKYNERFIIVTDYKTFLAIDTVTQDKLDIPINDLPKYYDFFLPWAGMEKTSHANENPADVKAAERMAKLFDEIKKENPDNSPEFVHSLNVFLSRLLFCFFAEDTNIFKEGQFTDTLSSHTSVDGSDLDEYLNNLFEVLNTPENQRKDFPNFLMDFPYVNGGLFKDKITLPAFNRKSRQAIIESGTMVWSAINPDIFGSMFQAVISVDQRGSLGQHYTSVPNIMKVIEPLFLTELLDEFEKAKGNIKKLVELTKRIQNIKIFDPACGSGNFLIIAYKELRKLEIDIFTEIDLTQGVYSNQYSLITLNNFFGIELDDFAHEIAKLALWLAEHQMNLEFFKKFGKTNPTLPLKDAGQITNGNACRLDWEKVCPKKDGDEIYILGNPPYLGGRMQDAEQKEDLKIAFKPFGPPKKVDYITAWFYNASLYIKGFNSKFSFVTTNSICQGEQVSMIWNNILDLNLEIDFAHTSFKWVNNAKGNAAVIVAIIGIRNISNAPKSIFIGNRKIQTNQINAYLANARNVFILKRSKSLSFNIRMEYGNMAIDGGFLILSPKEKLALLNSYPIAKKFIRRIYGAQEFLNDVERYCLWIKDGDLDDARKIPEIASRINSVREKRLDGNDIGSIKLADTPHQFREMKEGVNSALIIPTVSSERRQYLPIGFMKSDNVIIAPNQVIYDPEPFILSVLSSRMHMTWIRAVSGRLKTDFRYSSSLVFNTFPFPQISKQRKEELTLNAFRIIEVRENFSEKTLAEMYDPDKMPEELKEAHRLNDEAIEQCFRATPFSNDEERLEYLFKLYEKLLSEEQNSKTLFQKQKKTTKTK